MKDELLERPRIPEGPLKTLVRARHCADRLARGGAPGDGQLVLNLLVKETHLADELRNPWVSDYRDACERALRHYSEWWGLN